MASLASLMVTTQMGMIFFNGEGLCLNEGCKVVDRLTKVSPLLFNIAGLLFFQAIFWGLRLAKDDTKSWSKFVQLLLLAGLAAEGVLVGFQQIIAKTFCAYCLTIFAFIVLLNLLAGGRQFLHGACLFGVVLLAFFSLEFNQPQESFQAVKNGVFASKINTSSSATIYLFFSSTCRHCENVIEALKVNHDATLHFNPIDTVTSLDFPGVALNKGYSSASNRELLASLGIAEIPVLLVKTNEGFSIIKGEKAIIGYINNSGQGFRSPATGQSNPPRNGEVLISEPGKQKDGCSVATDCDTMTTPSQATLFSR